jgi:hypothetical protein
MFSFTFDKLPQRKQLTPAALAGAVEENPSHLIGHT